MKKITIYAVSEDMAQAAARYLADIFGGSTVAPQGTGYWWDYSIPPTLQVEPSYMVHTVVSALTKLEYEMAGEVARRLAQEYGQQAVLMTIEPVEVMRFVTANEAATDA